MALILTRAKRTLGAFLFSILIYIFPSLSGGCNVAEEKDGGAEMADVKESGDGAGADDGGGGCGSQCATYGPQSCTADADCQTYGENWYCGQGSFCQQSADAGPADIGYEDYGSPCAAYGPQPAPCSTDQECVTQNGAGWYCDKNHQVDMCGTPVTVPTCVPVGDN